MLYQLIHLNVCLIPKQINKQRSEQQTLLPKRKAIMASGYTTKVGTWEKKLLTDVPNYWNPWRRVFGRK
ncbi:hypothetical protein GDO81_021955 [Engystomops pustulosus]|uniref:Uncharacterized protein n=1 Tax=Engystomops pustulosus TaxID=76066 RepID=A0AAV6YSW5_ENGPU|nr:hypothetical protein GDO81_022882 [Engystomops pustulosus]KAG8538851.1 hypothetical protein GDO81_021955 [Engystomops pustulosus]